QAGKQCASLKSAAIVLLYVNHVYQFRQQTRLNNSCGRAIREWLCRWRFSQSRVAQPGLVPTLAAFVSRSAISTLPRFARDYSAPATLAVFVEALRLRTSDAEREQEVSQKPFRRCYTGITYSIKSAGQNDSFA